MTPKKFNLASCLSSHRRARLNQSRGNSFRQSVMYLPPNTPSSSISFGLRSGRNSGSKFLPAGCVRKYVYPDCIRSFTTIFFFRSLNEIVDRFRKGSQSLIGIPIVTTTLRSQTRVDLRCRVVEVRARARAHSRCYGHSDPRSDVSARSSHQLVRRQGKRSCLSAQRR